MGYVEAVATRGDICKSLKIKAPSDYHRHNPRAKKNDTAY